MRAGQCGVLPSQQIILCAARKNKDAVTRRRTCVRYLMQPCPHPAPRIHKRDLHQVSTGLLNSHSLVCLARCLGLRRANLVRKHSLLLLPVLVRFFFVLTVNAERICSGEHLLPIITESTNYVPWVFTHVTYESLQYCFVHACIWQIVKTVD